MSMLYQSLLQCVQRSSRELNRLVCGLASHYHYGSSGKTFSTSHYHYASSGKTFSTSHYHYGSSEKTFSTSHYHYATSVKTFSTSHPCRGPKKNSPYSSVDTELYSSLVKAVVSKDRSKSPTLKKEIVSKGGSQTTEIRKKRVYIRKNVVCSGSQTPERIEEQDEYIYGPVVKNPTPSQTLASKTHHPLLNPDRNDTLEEYKRGPPTQIILPRGENRSSVPSVTRILQKTMPPLHVLILARWRKKMIAKLGEEGFKEYTANLFRQGHLFHKAVEDFLALVDRDPVEETEPETMSIRPAVVEGYMESIRHVLDDVCGVRAIESTVQHGSLGYLGVVDSVAYYRSGKVNTSASIEASNASSLLFPHTLDFAIRGVLCVIDWKTSEKPKPYLRNTYDNPLQVAAYVGALNNDDNYSYQVDRGLIVVAYKDGSPAHPHLLSSEQTLSYWNEWLVRLEKYTTEESTLLASLESDSRDLASPIAVPPSVCVV